MLVSTPTSSTYLQQLLALGNPLLQTFHLKLRSSRWRLWDNTGFLLRIQALLQLVLLTL